jgi:hypothetical protein
MATITVTAPVSIGSLSYAATDDIVLSGTAASVARLTYDVNPNSLSLPRSIRGANQFCELVFQNTATAFTPGNLWRPNFEQAGSAVGANGTINLSGGATLRSVGDWLICYTATGAAGETILDASNVLGVDIDIPYAIQAESAPGSGVWDWVDVAMVGSIGNGQISLTQQTNFGTGTVNRTLFYDNSTRLLKTGDGTNGTLFAAGVRFRITNIWPYIGPFTAVTAAGWTTATGSQAVVSSANAPIAGAGNVNWLVGTEVLNISGVPTGTTVTVNNRGSDGTTAVAHAAGVTMYALPDGTSNMAGRILLANANFISYKTTWGRWWAFAHANPRSYDIQDSALVLGANTGTRTPTSAAIFVLMKNVLFYAHTGRGITPGCRPASNACPVSMENVRTVQTASLNVTASYTANANLVFPQNNSQLNKVTGIKCHRIGTPATGAQAVSTGLQIAGNRYNTSSIGDFSLIGCGSTITEVFGLTISKIRFSQTNGAANTSGVTCMAINNAIGCTIFDFNIHNGGVAPFNSWVSSSTAGFSNVIHNKVGGSVVTLDGQGRTFTAVDVFGADNTVACWDISNARGSNSTVVNPQSGSGPNTFRALKASNIGTSGAIGFAPSMTMDPSPARISPGAGYDEPLVYAYAAAYPSLTGFLHIGANNPQQNKALYAYLAGSPYYSVASALTVFQGATDQFVVYSADPVTGIASIPGTGSLFYQGSVPTTNATHEFRLCKWGDDISALGWTSFTIANVKAAFDALTGYSSTVGLNIQFRVTATAALANRSFSYVTLPVQMDTAYSPYVGSVTVAAVGAAAGAQMALYVGSGLWATTTISGSGAGSVRAPYDFDDVAVAGTLRIRALEAESIDLPVTWLGAGATVPTPMPPLLGYAAGPDTGTTFNKSIKKVTVSAAMSASPDLWSRYRRFIAQLGNYDIPDSWERNADGSLNLADWSIEVVGADLTGNLTTTGTATQSSGGRFLGTVVASNGTSGLLTLTGLTSATVALYDGTGVRVDYQASVTGTYTYALPFGSTGTWRWVVKRVGREHATQTFLPASGSQFTASPSLPQKLNPDGSAMYQGTTSTRITVTIPDTTTAFLDIGNGAPSLQSIFDESEDALITSAGMDWLGAGKDDIAIFNGSSGDFLFLTAGWRIRRRAPADANATVPAFVQSTDGEFIDESNGTVQYQTSDQASVIAAAVRANLADELARVVDLHQIHGLDSAAPLVVSPTTRTAGSIEQSISTVSDVVTVTRTA